ncbi:nucleoside-diphosphate sugar epimerase/dehydratase [Thiomonas sp. FB-6]|uniref:polysaccharide biosynthesis protein n=1 Tax=Thiomonas sp. FB-6 TaxID=1158291 RepID=UPI000371EB25|nr:nucleoside-diphosphate sugar epimerase/dehydratase [Thiomonas sp. FB-6]
MSRLADTWRRAGAAGLLDAALVALAWVAAFVFRFSLLRNNAPANILHIVAVTLPIAVLAWGAALVWFGIYRSAWRHASLPDVWRLARACAVAALALAAVLLVMRVPNFPRSIVLIHPLLAGGALLAVRLAQRQLAERSHRGAPGDARPLLLLGSVDDAAPALQSLRATRLWRAVAVYSPLQAEAGERLQDLPVLGPPRALGEVARAFGAQHALVAGSAGSATRRLLLEQASGARLALLTLPRADDWLQQGAGSTVPRNLELADLLGRAAVQLDVRGLSDLLAGQCVLVTGAGGSIGSELCRQIARFGVGRLVCLDMSEFAIYQLEQELRARHPDMPAVFLTANVRDATRLRVLFERQRPAVVFHAAAYKHVPLMEQDNAIEALRTNVLGTVNAARAAALCGARRFVLVSTDKAVNPTNVMGASKRLAERALQVLAHEHAGTRMVAVRFGNVLGSSGSVVPRFAQQIAAGGPVTVTHPDIVRYFMTIPEAAQLVLQAALMGDSGDIYVLDMGEPVRIVELARLMIRLSGRDEDEIPVVFTGLRPGEKLFEELLADDETTLPTPHPKLRVARHGDVEGPRVDLDALQRRIAIGGAEEPEAAAVKDLLASLVPEYRPQLAPEGNA